MNNEKIGKKAKVKKVRKPKKPELLHVKHFDYSLVNILTYSTYRGDQDPFPGVSEKNQKKLKYIVDNIKFYNERHMREQIFYIGELLYQAKIILKSTNIKFKKWVESNFDFGYHTAMNFCNVYIACLGKFDMICCVKTSVLYGISSPKFPEELRNYLIYNNLLESITNINIKTIYDEYKKNGFEFVRKKLEQKAIIPITKLSIIPYIDNLLKTLYILKKKKHELEHGLHFNEDMTLRKGITETGDDIILSSLQSINDSINLLETAKSKVYAKIDELDALLLEGANNDVSAQTVT